jgi:hypothetical protein
LDDTNPYASPQSIGLESYTPAVEQPVAWRQGDVLIVPRKGAVLPRACLISNESSGVWKLPITTFRDRALFLLVPLLLLPFAGVVCAGLCGGVLLLLGWVAEIHVWARWRVVLPLSISSGLSIPVALVGNVLTGIGILTRSTTALLVGGLCLAAGVVMMFIPGKLLTALKVEFKGGLYVFIRGVHPDYLDRLPEFENRSVPGT